MLLQGSASADVAGGFIALIGVTIAPGGVGEAKNGSRLSMQGNWDNNGTLRVMDGSTLDLSGTFDTPDIGVIQRTGTTVVQLFGTLTNTAQTLDLQTTTGSLRLNVGGTIVGGRVQSSGAATLTVGNDQSPSFTGGVTLATNLAFTPGSGGSADITGGLTLDNATIDMVSGGTGRGCPSTATRRRCSAARARS